MTPHNELAQSLITMGERLGHRGWLRATSGNLSARLDRDPSTFIITRSGVDKSQLNAHDFLLMQAGHVIEGTGTPSAETVIHEIIYRQTTAQAIFHVHTVFNNLVCHLADDHQVIFQGNEMNKALGFWEENSRVAIPVVDNYAELSTTGQHVAHQLNPDVPGILLNQHGIYAFGESMAAALRHLEALEFLFEWKIRLQSLRGSR